MLSRICAAFSDISSSAGIATGISVPQAVLGQSAAMSQTNYTATTQGVMLHSSDSPRDQHLHSKESVMDSQVKTSGCQHVCVWTV